MNSAIVINKQSLLNLEELFIALLEPIMLTLCSNNFFNQRAPKNINDHRRDELCLRQNLANH